MDKSEIEKYRRNLEKLQSELTDDVVKNMTAEEKAEYVKLVAKIQARLDIMENL